MSQPPPQPAPQARTQPKIPPHGRVPPQPRKPPGPTHRNFTNPNVQRGKPEEEAKRVTSEGEPKKKKKKVRLLDLLGFVFLMVVLAVLIYWGFKTITKVRDSMEESEPSVSHVHARAAAPEAEPTLKERPVIAMSPSTVHALRSLTEELRRYQ